MQRYGGKTSFFINRVQNVNGAMNKRVIKLLKRRMLTAIHNRVCTMTNNIENKKNDVTRNTQWIYEQGGW